MTEKSHRPARLPASCLKRLWKHLEDDFDSAIKSLNELRLESTDFKSENGQHTFFRPSIEVGGSWHSFLVSGGGSGGYSNAQDTVVAEIGSTIEDHVKDSLEDPDDGGHAVPGTMDMSLYIDPYDEAELAAQKIAMGEGHLDDGLIEAKKEKTLQKLYKNNPLLASNIAPFGFRCPFCPDRRTPGWTWTVLLDHATAYGKPGRYTYKVAGVHQALVDYMVLPMP